MYGGSVMNKDLLMTVDQVADELGLSPNVVRCKIRAGLYPFATYGKTNPKNVRNQYSINRNRFEKWKQGEI